MGGNLYLFNFTLEELKGLFQQKLQTKIRLDKPYKLCDFKPMYGYLFEKYLTGYEFWGHCDNDLIFGNITDFVTEYILKKYDRIFTRGHLTIYRNIPEVNSFFKESANYENIPSWKKVISSSQGFSFDEWPGCSLLWYAFKSDKLYDEIVFDDIAVQKKHFISAQKQDNDKSHFIFEYNNGELFRWYWDEQKGCINNEKTLYVHFQKRDFTIHTNNLTHYLIVPNKFIPYQPIDKKFILHYGRKTLFYPQYYRIRWNNLKRKLKYFI